MVDALLDALVDTGKLLPILFLTYLLMEYLEHHAGGGISRCLQRSRGAGPALGAALGLVPQCGFSGAASSLYAAGTITMGTLLSVFLATSDEMLPILLSAQVPLPTVGAILGLKFLAGAAVGFAVDAVLRLQHHQREPDIHGFCQQEHCSCEGGIFRSALRHTVKIVILISPWRGSALPASQGGRVRPPGSTGGRMFGDLPRFGKSGPALRLVRICLGREPRPVSSAGVSGRPHPTELHTAGGLHTPCSVLRRLNLYLKAIFTNTI